MWFRMRYRADVAKGELRVRMPAALHEALATQAAQQGVSLNTWIVTLLAAGYGFKLNEGDATMNTQTKEEK